ncbi:hypothetical protein ACOMHN_048409 [Nucella lapillus]
MPDNQTCPTSGFKCSIHFDRDFASDRLPYSQRTTDDQICVDFSRIRLEGERTTVNITRGSVYGFVKLTNYRFPLKRRYMEGTKCFASYLKKLTLMFTSDCDIPGNLLRDYFTSWIYVYAQPSEKHLVYYVDGTCRHTKSVPSARFNLTVRSIYWRDTAQEPRLQNCILAVETSSSIYLVGQRAKLCTKWNFTQTSCQVVVRLLKVLYNDRLDYAKSINYSCSVGKGSRRDHCVPYSILNRPGFLVVRNESIEDDTELEDGTLLFEVQGGVEYVKEEKKKEYEMFDYGEDVGMGSSKEGIDNLPMKVLFPVAVLFCMCCICGVTRKLGKARRGQSSQNGEAYATACSIRTEQDGHAGARVPLNPPRNPARNPPLNPARSPSVSDPHPYQAGAAVRRREGEGDRMAAPPPAYGDLDHKSYRPSRDDQPFGAAPSASVPPPVSAGESRFEPPPPPISDELPSAPPAYHELFPSAV